MLNASVRPEPVARFISANHAKYLQGDFNLGNFSLGLQRTEEQEREAMYASAEAGDADAQYDLGAACDNVVGTPRNYAEAVRWYRRAAEQGHVDAQFVLGVRYFYGVGIVQDDTEAVRWFSLAAAQGLPDAQYQLGFAYDFACACFRTRAKP